MSNKRLKNIDVLINDYCDKREDVQLKISKAEGKVRKVLIEKFFLLDDFINILEEFKDDGFYSEEHGILFPEK